MTIKKCRECKWFYEMGTMPFCNHEAAQYQNTIGDVKTKFAEEMRMNFGPCGKDAVLYEERLVSILSGVSTSPLVIA